MGPLAQTVCVVLSTAEREQLAAIVADRGGFGRALDRRARALNLEVAVLGGRDRFPICRRGAAGRTRTALRPRPASVRAEASGVLLLVLPPGLVGLLGERRL
jgi:hypothetical protein